MVCYAVQGLNFVISKSLLIKMNNESTLTSDTSINEKEIALIK